MNIVKPTLEDEGRYWWLRVNHCGIWLLRPVEIDIHDGKVLFVFLGEEDTPIEEKEGEYEFICPCVLPECWNY